MREENKNAKGKFLHMMAKKHSPRHTQPIIIFIRTQAHTTKRIYNISFFFSFQKAIKVFFLTFLWTPKKFFAFFFFHPPPCKSLVSLCILELSSGLRWVFFIHLHLSPCTLFRVCFYENSIWDETLPEMAVFTHYKEKIKKPCLYVCGLCPRLGQRFFFCFTETNLRDIFK